MVAQKIEYVLIPCALCNSDKGDVIYERAQPTGPILGDVKVQLVMCRDCGFVYMNPRLNRETMLKYYEGNSAASGRNYSYLNTNPNSRYGRLTDERVSVISKNVKTFSKGRLLDIGASYGNLLLRLNLPGWDLVGIEPSEHAFNLAKARYLNMIHTNIEDVNVDTLGKFDVICLLSVLEHVYDPNVAMAKVKALLKSEGILIIEVPDSNNPLRSLAEFYSFEHLSHFTLGSLSHLLARFGFEIVYVDDDVCIRALRVIARKTELIDTNHKFPDDRKRLLKAIQQYRYNNKMLEQNLRMQLEEKIQRWKDERKKIAIYGAGLHTRFLLKLIDFKDCIVCILDSDPAKTGTRFMDWNIYGPDSISQSKLDVIVISSGLCEEEIYHQIQSYNLKDIEIVRCYPQ